MAVEGIGRINAGLNINKITSFRPNNSRKDIFVKSPVQTDVVNYASVPLKTQYSPRLLLNAFLNENYINSLVEKNPEIKEILSSVGIKKPVVCVNNVKNMIHTHLSTTNACAMKIANEMNLSPADKKTLETAALFHDFGKVLIPQEILEKNKKLNFTERKIVDTHAKLGEELLKTAGVNKRVAELAGNHHKQSNDILCNILSVADIYSALTEKRSYKDAFTQGEALKILDQKAAAGEVSTEVVSALKSSLMQACA